MKLNHYFQGSWDVSTPRVSRCSFFRSQGPSLIPPGPVFFPCLRTCSHLLTLQLLFISSPERFSSPPPTNTIPRPNFAGSPDSLRCSAEHQDHCFQILATSWTEPTPIPLPLKTLRNVEQNINRKIIEPQQNLKKQWGSTQVSGGQNEFAVRVEL